MPLYSYVCNHCGEKFDKQKPSADRFFHDCPKCSQPCANVPTVAYDHWGFDLDEASHHVGNPDKLVSDRPSNEGFIRV
ncbi:hypothetical protein LCGC14_1130430 [marine sediment metagenome]|uniref:Putative regulatory protein FmdB zinc ribbon domain-containing protein n=1 Tax=marine sediment metagenome TaxID=412755 RepID=A0A0F9M640_9ZZZZ